MRELTFILVFWAFIPLFLTKGQLVIPDVREQVRIILYKFHRAKNYPPNKCLANLCQDK